MRVRDAAGSGPRRGSSFSSSAHCSLGELRGGVKGFFWTALQYSPRPQPYAFSLLNAFTVVPRAPYFCALRRVSSNAERA